MTSSAGEIASGPFNQRFLRKVFLVFALLALASAGLSVAGREMGRMIAMAGHTDDRRIHEIVIGNDVLSVRANAIRSVSARVDGVAPRLDLYLRWPELEGYTVETRDDFNHAGPDARIVFASIEPTTMSRDMSGRYDPIYAHLIEPATTSSRSGVRIHRFKATSGYVNEVLAVADRRGAPPFVARCLSGQAAEASLAPCQRDIAIGRDLSLSYRFPERLLAEWRLLDDSMRSWAATHIRAAGDQPRSTSRMAIEKL